MRHGLRIYSSFEEFEREELRSGESLGRSVDDLMETIMLEELDFDAEPGKKRRGEWDDQDDDGEE